LFILAAAQGLEMSSILSPGLKGEGEIDLGAGSRTSEFTLNIR